MRGDGRLAAARLLKLKKVPCIQLGHLTEKQKRAYFIADNKIAQNSFWNDEFLRLELTELKGLGANLELIGLNPMEIADICAIVDELHAHRTRKVNDVLETATGARAQPLIWKITTAGSDKGRI